MNLRTIRLGEIADVVAGVSYAPDGLSSCGIRILRGGNIQANEIRLKDDDVFLDVTTYRSAENTVRAGDTIVVASTGSTEALGKAATSFEDMPNTQIGAFLRIVRPKERKYWSVVSAWMTQPIFQRYIVDKAKGTGINNVRREHILDYPILTPSGNDLEMFSQFYEALDRKISLNRQKIKTLEAMAKEIYDYWFVQYDFPDANGRPYKSSGGKMVYSPEFKRDIPEGWRIVDIKTVCQVVDCLHSKKPEYCFETEKSYLLTLEVIAKPRR